jgi:hypothetical protein
VLLPPVFSAAVSASAVQVAELGRSIDSLSAFDYETRTSAARMLRRAPETDVVPALVAAVRDHKDQYVRYRALILLTSFGARETQALMRSLLADRNDRVREVVYRWFERNPDASLTGTLLAALNTEQSEFVRPVLVRAIAALPPDDFVRRALVAEVGRGLDFFRSAVIQAVGQHRAAYAVDALAAVAELNGPLQDDAVLALGRIGGVASQRILATLLQRFSANPTPPPITLSLHAAYCLVDDTDCGARFAVLADVAGDPRARAEDVRAAVDALVVLAGQGHPGARNALYMKVAPVHRGPAALGLSEMALQRPSETAEWLVQLPEADQMAVIELLHEGFERLEEDFSEEQFFAAARAAYWKADEGSTTRTVVATLIDRLEF